MPRRSLANLLKIRHSTVTEAKAALASALAAESAACAEEATATSCIEEELDAASAESADDATVEALAAWLPLARTRQSAARERRQAAELATTRARATIAAARGAEAAVEGIIEAGEAEARAEAERLAELELNENLLARRTQSHD